MKRRLKRRNAWFWRFKQRFKRRNASGFGVFDIYACVDLRAARVPRVDAVVLVDLRRGLVRCWHVLLEQVDLVPGPKMAEGWRAEHKKCVRTVCTQLQGANT